MGGGRWREEGGGRWERGGGRVGGWRVEVREGGGEGGLREVREVR